MSGLYAGARQAFLDGDIDWTLDTIYAYLIDAADYTVDLANHDFLNEVPAPARVAGPVTLSGKTSVNGVAGASAWTHSGVSGDPIEAVLLVRWSGAEGTSRLVAYIDSGTGLPITPNGAGITITPDTGPNKLFKL